jgi:hypothetical protein
MRIKMKTAALICSIALSLLAPPFARAADDDNAAEMKRMEGRFERFFQNAAGTTFRVYKEVIGDQSTVTTFDDVGNVIESHTSTVKIEKRGPVKVYSFFNLMVTAGPNKGHVEPGTNSYIYRDDGETVTEAWGLLEGDPNPPRMFRWKRIKDSK